MNYQTKGDNRRSAFIALIIIIWVGVAFRFRGLFANTFHADEALFATWARLIAVWRDPLLLTQAVDKPPLPFYLQSMFYPLFGPVEWAARMPAFIASLLLIPLTAQLARRLTGDRVVGLLAAFFVAVAPLAIQFSATAFTDPLLTFWLVAALYSIAAPGMRQGSPRPLLAGLLFGLAMATKYQALLFAPLVVGIGWLSGRRRGEWFFWAAGLGFVLLPLLAWQWSRPEAVGLVALQWANIGGIRPARSWELWPRALDTIRLWWLALGWPLVVGGGLVFGGFIWARRGRARSLPMDALLLLFVLGYVLLHWLWAVPMWDRYLLPILPLVAILWGRAVVAVGSAVRRHGSARKAFAVIMLAVISLSISSGLAARVGQYPIGGQPQADGGASIIAQLLKDAPYGTVLYDHWYSWHWNYQLFNGRVFVSWFPHADALVKDLAVFAGDGSDRYIALPASAVGSPIGRHLSDSGYVLERVSDQSEAANVTLYRILIRESD